MGFAQPNDQTTKYFYLLYLTSNVKEMSTCNLPGVGKGVVDNVITSSTPAKQYLVFKMRRKLLDKILSLFITGYKCSILEKPFKYY